MYPSGWCTPCVYPPSCVASRSPSPTDYLFDSGLVGAVLDRLAVTPVSPPPPCPSFRDWLDVERARKAIFSHRPVLQWAGSALAAAGPSVRDVTEWASNLTAIIKQCSCHVPFSANCLPSVVEVRQSPCFYVLLLKLSLCVAAFYDCLGMGLFR